MLLRVLKTAVHFQDNLIFSFGLEEPLPFNVGVILVWDLLACRHLVAAAHQVNCTLGTQILTSPLSPQILPVPLNYTSILCLF